MNSTALGAEKENINFISEAHEKFYYEKIQKVREADVYHKALCYCIGMNEDTRRNVDRIYNFKTGCVKPECLHEGWQTSGSAKVVRMAFNLYCNGTPKITNIKAYMITALYNAPTTINHFYQQEVQHDMYGGGWHAYL